MNNVREKIVNSLEALGEINGVRVEMSDEQKTVYVQYASVQSLDFKFIWSVDHFIGYFLDREEHQSQAVIALWSKLEAVKFASSYSLLVELRAGRK